MFHQAPDFRGLLLVGYEYHQKVIDALAQHGVIASRNFPPQRLRDVVRDLYRYEIRRLRSELLAGRIPKREYAGHVIALRKRYWLLSVPVHLWTQ